MSPSASSSPQPPKSMSTYLKLSPEITARDRHTVSSRAVFWEADGRSDREGRGEWAQRLNRAMRDRERERRREGAREAEEQFPPFFLRNPTLCRAPASSHSCTLAIRP